MAGPATHRSGVADGHSARIHQHLVGPGQRAEREGSSHRLAPGRKGQVAAFEHAGRDRTTRQSDVDLERHLLGARELVEHRAS